jgi:hypothetical protein
MTTFLGARICARRLSIRSPQRLTNVGRAIFATGVSW